MPSPPEVVHDITSENEPGAPFIMTICLVGKPVDECGMIQPVILIHWRRGEKTFWSQLPLQVFSAPNWESWNSSMPLPQLRTVTSKVSKSCIPSTRRNLRRRHVLFSDLEPLVHTRDYLRSLVLNSVIPWSTYQFSPSFTTLTVTYNVYRTKYRLYAVSSKAEIIWS